MKNNNPGLPKQISTIVGNLHETEKKEIDGKKIHIGASIEGKIINDELHLDILARFMTTREEDVCTSVCLYEGKLLVANNSGKAESYNETIAVLRAFLKVPFAEGYTQLVAQGELIAKDILSYPKTKRRIDGLELADKEKFQDLGTIRKVLKNNRVSSSIDNSKVTNLAIDIYQPVIDANNIAQAIIKNEIDPKMIKAISDGQTEFIVGSDRLIHGEMKIAEYISTRGEEGKKEESRKYDIGVSKLCCCPCFITLELAKEKLDIDFSVRGTHGGTYESWRAPRILQEEILARWFCCKVE